MSSTSITIYFFQFSFSSLYLDPPINVTIVSFSWSFVVINWISPFYGRAIDFADLYRVIAQSNEEEVTVPTTETYARIDGLKQLTNYSLNVQAWNGLGYGPFLVTGIPFRTPGKKAMFSGLKIRFSHHHILTGRCSFVLVLLFCYFFVLCLRIEVLVRYMRT